MQPGALSIGCGQASVYDYDFTHPVASQYRFRVRPRSASGGSVVEGTGSFRPPTPALPPRVVINEFRTRGPNGPDDQFIELFNSSLSPAPMGGNLNAATNSNLAPPGLFVPDVVIGPLCHYLIASSGFTGKVKPDLTMQAFLTDDGSISYGPRTSPNTTQRDTVGMSSRAGFYEGSPLPPFPPEDIDRSYVRIGTDTNDNLHDFAQRAGTPQNSSSCGVQ